MTLNLKELLSGAKSRLPFEYVIDLSELDFFGEHPFKTGVHITGEVTMLAGIPILNFSLQAELLTLCASCGKPARRRFTLSEERVLSDKPTDAENDEVALYHGDLLELDTVVTDAVVLGVDIRILCKDDCKGLCPICGADLNEGDCGCKPETDPRLAKLKELL